MQEFSDCEAATPACKTGRT